MKCVELRNTHTTQKGVSLPVTTVCVVLLMLINPGCQTESFRFSTISLSIRVSACSFCRCSLCLWGAAA